MAKTQRTMNLRYVGVADFRKSDETMLVELLSTRKLNLASDDVVMFRSGRGDQVVFVHAVRDIPDEKRPRRVIASERLRLSWGTWSDGMIGDYAEMVGIHLLGVRTMRSFFKALAEEIRALRIARSS